MKKRILIVLSLLMLINLVGCQTKTETIDYDKYCWEVPTIVDETYEQYYSKEHIYYQRSVNQLLFKEKINGYSFDCSGNGIILHVINEEGKTTDYQIATGDYKNCLDASLFDDGYWFYFYTLDSDNNIKGLIRVNLKGEKEIIFEDIVDSGIMNFHGYIEGKSTKVLDHNVMIAICENDSGMSIKRIYLPDMTIEEYETPLLKDTVEYETLEQINTKHIYYKGIDPDYYAKYLELKEDKVLADSLIEKYNLANAYEGVKDDYLNYHLNDVCRYILWQEYGLYAYSSYDLDMESKETTIKQIESYVDYPVYDKSGQK